MTLPSRELVDWSQGLATVWLDPGAFYSKQHLPRRTPRHMCWLSPESAYNQPCRIGRLYSPTVLTWMREGHDNQSLTIYVGSALPQTLVVFDKLVHLLMRTEPVSDESTGGTAQARNHANTQCLDNRLMEWPALPSQRIRVVKVGPPVSRPQEDCLTCWRPR